MVEELDDNGTWWVGIRPTDLSRVRAAVGG